MINFLKANYTRLTNKQLAFMLDLRLTVTRNKLRELGLKRIEMEYWTDEQVQCLKDQYGVMGDVEMAHLFNNRWPKNKKWTKCHIAKKRGCLNLHRTNDQYKKIRTKNSSAGGNAFTIDKNSCSKNLHDRYVAGLIAWRDPELREELMHNPGILEAKRQQVQLNRAIKKLQASE